MRRFVVLALLLGLMALLQTLQVTVDAPLNPLSLATFGFVLLAAYTLGQVAANLQLPKITGYIVTGLLFGPQILNIFSSAVEADLRVVNDLAIGLIALSAGAEMHLPGLKRIARSLFWIVFLKGLLILVAVMATVYALAPFLPFLADQPTGLVLSVGMILGVLAMGTSPAATIAVISETGAKGRLADTTLGVAVAKDIVMVVMLALAIALARTFSPDGHGFEIAILGDLAFELGLSLAAGAILGLLIIGYMRFVNAELWLFVVGITFAMTAMAHQFHLEALLVFIVAGFVVQNFSTLGHDFVHLVEKVALPVYVVFFSVAGAGLDLGALQSVLLVALALVGVRLVAIYVGTAAATRIAGEPDNVRRYAWLSFVSQAGVVIGLSIIVENNLPGLGAEIRTLVMGTVAIHLLVGPVLFKVALSRAGEIPSTARDKEEVDESPDDDAESAPARRLPTELADPIDALEKQVMEGLEALAKVANEGPLHLGQAVKSWPTDDRARKEDLLAQTSWSREMNIVTQRFWSTVHAAALAAPRQVGVPLEDKWFEKARWDTGSERWAKRGRRFRRVLKRLSGTDPELYRSVPVRAMALYHIDNALAVDLRPVVATLAAQPALVLRDGLRAAREATGRETPRKDPEARAAEPQALDHADAMAELVPVIERRFNILRRELAEVGTASLPAGKRRPSGLHERADRARAQTTEAVGSWRGLADSVVEYQRRADSVEKLRVTVRTDSEEFARDFDAALDEVVGQPLQRARDVVQEAGRKIAALAGAESNVIEDGLVDISESVSAELRRHALAGLRRSMEARTLNQHLKRFDDSVEQQLQALPESFQVIDPEELPGPDRSPKAYPEPTSHEFRLIATGAVERTLRPSILALGERCDEATQQAAQVVQEVREALELRFEAAVDTVMEESRSERRSGAASPVRGSLEVASRGIEKALAAIDRALETRQAIEGETLQAFRDDFAALVERLGSQLSSARSIEARLQAERARVELRGTAVLRLLGRRIQRSVFNVLVRWGLRSEDDGARGELKEREAPVPLRPAGRAGSDRAVLFHILFDHTTLAGKIFDGALILTIIASILVLMLESVVPVRAEYGTTLAVLEWLFTLLFTLEYIARLWTVDRPARYAFSFFGVIDLLAVVPTYLSLLLPGGQVLMVIRVLRVARAFRVLKLARYVGEAQVLVDALKASRVKITVFLVYVLSMAVVAGSVMYLIEGPEAGFTSIPRGVYWSIVTLTTVGFGDITPQSPIGQALAAALMVLGYGIIAVPTGIVTAEIAGRPGKQNGGHRCHRCGHEADSSTAAYCSVCGATLAE